MNNKKNIDNNINLLECFKYILHTKNIPFAYVDKNKPKVLFSDERHKYNHPVSEDATKLIFLKKDLKYEGQSLCALLSVQEHKRVIYHSLLFYLMDSKETPDIIINYIYIHLYELLNETDILEENTYHELYFIYVQYYNFICQQPAINWFKTLFPPVSESLYFNNFSFKNFYVGLVGRVMNNSFDTVDESELAFYWYGDPKDWSIGYHLYINSKNKLEINKCKFIVTDEFKTDHYNRELLNRYDLAWRDYVYVLYKTTAPSLVDEDTFYEPHLDDDYDSIRCRAQRYAVEAEDVEKEFEFKGISELYFNQQLIIYKENINRSSELSQQIKKKLDKKRFDERRIDSTKYNFENYAKCSIEDYDKKIRHLGYNEKLGDLWNQYKKEQKKVERDEINSRLKKMKGKI